MILWLLLIKIEVFLFILYFYRFYLNSFPYYLIHFINIFIYLFLNYCFYVNTILIIVSFSFFSLLLSPNCLLCFIDIIIVVSIQYRFFIYWYWISFGIFQIDFFVNFTSFLSQSFSKVNIGSPLPYCPYQFFSLS